MSLSNRGIELQAESMFLKHKLKNLSFHSVDCIWISELLFLFCWFPLLYIFLHVGRGIHFFIPNRLSFKGANTLSKDSNFIQQNWVIVIVPLIPCYFDISLLLYLGSQIFLVGILSETILWKLSRKARCFETDVHQKAPSCALLTY